MQHSFDVELAQKYGLLEAIIFNNLNFWIAKNEANETNFHDGYYWTYNSVKAFSRLFPYVSERQIQYALKHLVDEGIIQTGRYNQMAYDRTLWYAFTDFGKSIMQNCKMEKLNLSNGNVDFVEPIPDNKPDKKPNNNTDIYMDKKQKRFKPPTVDEVKAYCIERQNNVDAERFIDYYTANGWKVGKNTMKDWKAAVRTWERNGYSAKGKVGVNGVRLADHKPDDDGLDGIF